MAGKPSASRAPSGPSGVTRAYLFAYNTLNLLTWGSCVVYAISLLPANVTTLPNVFRETFSPLLLTQSIALLEVVHSVLGLVRAPFMTTAMQVASRLLLVWGIMAQFGGDIVGARTVQIGDYAYLGCVAAWGITEVIRYGFFAITLSGGSVPSWWTWLRCVFDRLRIGAFFADYFLSDITLSMCSTRLVSPANALLLCRRFVLRES
jgi:very-long-chain (3R)-3-hydroxyacyl-CoA dehydratase